MNEGRSALVTGAASGIGRATAERLARSGWRVLAVDRDIDKLAWTEGSTGIAAMAADVASEADNARMAAEAEARFGGLDAAVLNAGITGGGSIDELSFADFQKVIAVNLFGPVLGVKAVLPLLRKGRNPAIAITSSTMGIAGDSGNWAYGTSKHALIGLVRSLSRELGWEGIRINALCPGPTRTGMTGAMETIAPAHYDLLTRQVPLQRWADPDEMASVIEFLISPAASYVNGHAMVADGGAVVGTGLLLPASGAARAIPGDGAT
ncbi:MAG: SDR family oxidoreductase [Novosphingobium sp.]|jgi:NAD(P)-dependent dehydrogenase (short-subunit alcohol dehydrogenase family)|nr:SDR family oxidoreductase [Novosphingobium sp.]